MNAKAYERRIREATTRLEAGDPALASELRQVRAQGDRPPGRGASTGALESHTTPASVPAGGGLETIVLRVGRPVLAVVHGQPRLEFGDVKSEVWRARLDASAGPLREAARAVGRIDVRRHPYLQWVGTGWLVDAGIIVTNRHVALQFAAARGGAFTFRQGLGGPMGVSIDFLREVERDDRFEARVIDVLLVADEDGPDVALLRIEPLAAASAPVPIRLDEGAAEAGRQVAVIGYPARDSRVPDQDLMLSIFGDVYDRKRLAPGQITDVEPGIILHDCSTLGGNSGSVVLDLASGQAVGLHFAGRFLEANYAVAGHVVAEWVHDVQRGGSGVPRPGDAWRPPPPALAPPHGNTDVFVETRVEDYVDRDGYDEAFLGSTVPMPMPLVRDDVLTFPSQERAEHELRYEHFSVVMSRSRRLCLVSAVNIDGREPKRARRPGWRLDPRISADAQIRDLCYGNPPRFSRGHMTRREDPIWGTPEAAERGNDDSMHVTNAVPQMQPFNAGIWLGLEDYALEHARSDDMRISVFTGPFLRDDDPMRFEVRIPVEFWKVIAFIHDDTGSLSATGYTMSQRDFLREEEFVFGQHQTCQVTIASIEQRTGIGFGDLASRDPFATTDEAVAAPLTAFGQIVFR